MTSCENCKFWVQTETATPNVGECRYAIPDVGFKQPDGYFERGRWPKTLAVDSCRLGEPNT